MLDFEELGRWIGETDRRLRQLELMAVPAELRDRAPTAQPATDAPMLRNLRDAAGRVRARRAGCRVRAGFAPGSAGKALK
jgi:hypothetical protein